jgi:hypothetical protein
MNASKQFIDVIAILKQHSQLENTAETRFQDFRDYKFVPRTPQRLISSSRERQNILLVFLSRKLFFTYKLYLCPAVLSLFYLTEYV